MLLTKSFIKSCNKKYKPSVENAALSKADTGTYELFLSYNFKDQSTAKEIKTFLENCGFTVYADWTDPSLSRDNVSKNTAQTLRNSMKRCKGLLYLHSQSAASSKWCPWEVGLFSALRNNRCANLPIVQSQEDEFKGQEYLGLYPYLDYVIDAQGKPELRVCESDKKYVSLKKWLSGAKIKTHLRAARGQR